MKCRCGEPSCSLLHTMVWNLIWGLFLGAVAGTALMLVVTR